MTHSVSIDENRRSVLRLLEIPYKLVNEIMPSLYTKATVWHVIYERNSIESLVCVSHWGYAELESCCVSFRRRAFSIALYLCLLYMNMCVHFYSYDAYVCAIQDKYEYSVRECNICLSLKLLAVKYRVDESSDKRKRYREKWEGGGGEEIETHAVKGSDRWIKHRQTSGLSRFFSFGCVSIFFFSWIRSSLHKDAMNCKSIYIECSEREKVIERENESEREWERGREREQTRERVRVYLYKCIVCVCVSQLIVEKNKTVTNEYK